MKRITLGIVFILFLGACSSETDEINNIPNLDEDNPYVLYSEVIDYMNQEVYYYEEVLVETWDGEFGYEETKQYSKNENSINWISLSYMSTWHSQYLEVSKTLPFNQVFANNTVYSISLDEDSSCIVEERELIIDNDSFFSNEISYYKEKGKIKSMEKEKDGRITILTFNYANVNRSDDNKEMRIFVGEDGYIEKIILQRLNEGGEIVETLKTWTYSDINKQDSLDIESAIETLPELGETCSLSMEESPICGGESLYINSVEAGNDLKYIVTGKWNNSSLIVQNTKPVFTNDLGEYFEYHLYTNVTIGDTKMRRTEGWFAIHKCTGEIFQINVGTGELTPFE